MNRFEHLADVLDDDRFIEVDLRLRRGFHLGREDHDLYAFVLDAQAPLERFYERYSARLTHRTDGYFFLVPAGDRLARRFLSAGEMLVGQALALLYLDPSTLQDGGVIDKAAVLRRLDGLLGLEALHRALAPRRQRIDERVAAETVRTRVAAALRELADLGFVDLLSGERLRLRSALLRFSDPVRPSPDPGGALARLIRDGQATTTPDDDEDSSAADEASDTAPPQGTEPTSDTAPEGTP